jgi:hypothetical protein
MICKENKFLDISGSGSEESRGKNPEKHKSSKPHQIFSLFALHTIYSDLNPSFPALFLHIKAKND